MCVCGGGGGGGGRGLKVYFKYSFLPLVWIDYLTTFSLHDSNLLALSIGITYSTYS